MIFLYASHVHEGFAENMDYGLSKLYLPYIIQDDYKLCVLREQKNIIIHGVTVLARWC